MNEGTISTVKGVEELRSLPFVRKSFIDDLKVGQETGLPTYKGARKGPILVSGDDIEDLENNIHIVQNTLQVEVMEGNGSISAIHWS